MSKPKLNDKLIQCVLEHIESEVAEGNYGYDQNVWACIELKGKRAIKCNSAGCFAGWTCMLSTPTKKWYDTFNLGVDPRGDAYEWADEAQKKLGLTQDEADYLFGSVNSSDRAVQLDRIKKRIAYIREARSRNVDLSEVLHNLRSKQWPPNQN